MIHDYINHQDLLEKLGYREYKPKLGSLGRVIITAANQGSVSWIKNQLDSMFKKVRDSKRQRNNETKRRKRHPNKRNDKDAA